SILFLGHLLLYVTWAHFWGPPFSSTTAKVIFVLLSVSFVLASLRGWYSHRPVVRVLYTLAAVWLGFASYFLWAALTSWIVLGLAGLFGLGWAPKYIADVLFGAAGLAGVYGLVNASLLRVTRISVALPGLPQAWRGRTAALVSDTHLGHIRNGR